MNAPLQAELDRQSRQLQRRYVEVIEPQFRPMMARFGMESDGLHANARHQTMALNEALALELPELYGDWVAWLMAMLREHGVPPPAAQATLEVFHRLARSQLDSVPEALLEATLLAGEEQLNSIATPQQSDLGSLELREARHRLLQSLLTAQQDQAWSIVEQCCEMGLDHTALLEELLAPLLYETGRLWQMGEISVAQEHLLSASVQRLIDRLAAALEPGPARGPRMLLLVVEGELHSLGAQMVSQIFQLAGWELDYLGANTPNRAALAAMEKREPDLIGLSLTLTPSLRPARELIASIRRQHPEGPPLLVGGSLLARMPILATKLGADAMALDGHQGLERAAELIGQPVG